MANIQWNKAIEKGRAFLPIIRDYDPEAIDEVRGIAEGANCQMEEIIALNSRTELMFLTEKLRRDVPRFLYFLKPPVMAIPSRDRTGIGKRNAWNRQFFYK